MGVFASIIQRICACEFPFLSFFVCVSVVNEHSCRINSRMIKQLQVSTYVKHRVGVERCGWGAEGDQEDAKKGKTRDD